MQRFADRHIGLVTADSGDNRSPFTRLLTQTGLPSGPKGVQKEPDLGHAGRISRFGWWGVGRASARTFALGRAAVMNFTHPIQSRDYCAPMDSPDRVACVRRLTGLHRNAAKLTS